MAKLTIDIPDSLIDQVKSAGRSVEAVLLQVLMRYVEEELPAKDITQSRTWELRGRFSVSETVEAENLSAGEAKESRTNYAEQVDDVLYTGF